VISILRTWHSARALCSLALATGLAALIGVSTGCDSGADGGPSGYNSAANGVAASTANVPRLTGFILDEGLPTGFGPIAGGEAWLFVTTNKQSMNGPAMSNVSLLVNGQPAGGTVATIQAFGTGNRSFVIRMRNRPTAGQLLQVDATVGGTQTLSNSLTVPQSNIPAGNKPASPGFEIGINPVQGQQAPRPVQLDFDHKVPPGQAGSYLALIVDVNADQNGQVTSVDPGAAIEIDPVTLPLQYTMGTTTSCIGAIFNPAQLAAPNGVVYMYCVIPLNSDGWGIGTTSDGSFQNGIWRLFAAIPVSDAGTRKV